MHVRAFGPSTKGEAAYASVTNEYTLYFVTVDSDDLLATLGSVSEVECISSPGRQAVIAGLWQVYVSVKWMYGYCVCVVAVRLFLYTFRPLDLMRLNYDLLKGASWGITSMLDKTEHALISSVWTN